MDYVFDASPLIYLGKARALEKISLLSGKKFIPQLVYDEVVLKGLERRESEAAYVNNLIREKKFLVEKPKVKREQKAPLSQADLDVISLAKEKNAIAIIDEIYAREVAESVGVKRHGTLYLILLLLKEKRITKKEAKQYIDGMIHHGFYISIEMYKETMKKIEMI